MIDKHAKHLWSVSVVFMSFLDGTVVERDFDVMADSPRAAGYKALAYLHDQFPGYAEAGTEEPWATRICSLEWGGTMTFVEELRKINACSEAVDWVGARTLEQAWAECPRGDWMLWLAAKAGVDRRTVVLAACACARTALQYVPPGEDRPRVAIETAEAWARGEATLEQVADAAAEAAADAAAYAAAYAAAEAAAHAANAAAYAAYAAAEAAAYAARASSLANSADMVRQHITVDAVRAALEEVNT